MKRKSIVSNVTYKVSLILFLLINFQKFSLAAPCDGSYIGAQCCHDEGAGPVGGCGQDYCLSSGFIPNDGDICNNCTCDAGFECKWHLFPPDYQSGEGICYSTSCTLLGQHCNSHTDCCDSSNVPGTFCKDNICTQCGHADDFCCQGNTCDDEDNYSCARTRNDGYKECCLDTDDDNVCDSNPTWICGGQTEACCNNQQQPCSDSDCNANNSGFCTTSCTCNGPLTCMTDRFSQAQDTVCLDLTACGVVGEPCCSGGTQPCYTGECSGGVCKEIRPFGLLYTGPIITSLEQILGPATKILYYGGLSIGVFFIILSGYRLMTSEGDPQRTKAAQEQLTAAIIGIIFILLSVTILRVIINQILGESI